jgi:DNA polymerase elongation subunit (family B)
VNIDDEKTFQNLENLSESELRELLNECEAESVRMETRQMALKVQLNSCYGSLGSEWFRYYSLDMAVAITRSGQLSIRWLINALNSYLNDILSTESFDYVIASDTDSVYLNLEPLVRKVFPKDAEKKKIINFLNSACEKIKEKIDEACLDLAQYMNACANKMSMEREVIADRGFWTAKKRYALNVWDSEGVRYEKPKLKIKGIETQRSSTPEIARNALKKCIEIILNENESKLQDFVADFKKKFFDSSPEVVAKPTSCNGLKKYSDPNRIFKDKTPAHVKGALIFNFIVEERGLAHRYPKLMEGEKVKFVYMKTPNPLGIEGISFTGFLPEELDLHKYIDYNKLYELNFLSPLSAIVSLLGWSTERKNDLETLFN